VVPECAEDRSFILAAKPGNVFTDISYCCITFTQFNGPSLHRLISKHQCAFCECKASEFQPIFFLKMKRRGEFLFQVAAEKNKITLEGYFGLFIVSCGVCWIFLWFWLTFLKAIKLFHQCVGLLTKAKRGDQ